MREINPRAWSIDGECWCTRVDYDGYKKEWSGIVPVLAPDNRSKIIGEIEDTNIIVEFPIGLKDKNGKKICDGDIVEYTTHYYGNEKRHRKVVEWEEWDSDDFGEPHNLGYFNLSEYMTVIGNIHENPELLDVKEEG